MHNKEQTQKSLARLAYLRVRIVIRRVYNKFRLEYFRIAWLLNTNRLDGGQRQFIWISQYYRTDDVERQKEIDTAFNANSNLPFISKIVIFAEREALSIPVPANAEIIPLNRRLSFNDVLDYIGRSKLDPRTVFCVSNSDIELTQDVEGISLKLSERQLIALTRWEPNGGLTYMPLPEIHQDCWMLRSKDVDQVLRGMEFIPFGVPGCDNRFARVFHDAGFGVWNPCLNTRTFHLHASKIRNYDESMRIRGGYFFPIECAAEEFYVRQRPRFILSDASDG